MSFIDEVEFGCGVLSVPGALLSFFIVLIPEAHRLEELGYSFYGVLLRGVIVLILPAILIAVGAYLHVKCRHAAGLLLILIPGLIVSFFHAVSLLLGEKFGGHLWLGGLTGVFAFLTIIAGIANANLDHDE